MKTIFIYFFIATSVSVAPPVNFKTKILPILKKSCFKCHSQKSKKPKTGLRLDAENEMKKFEELIAPRDPTKSSLYTLASLPKGHDNIMPSESKAPVLLRKVL
ncbi:MAG: hypothetical protein NE334_04440 [Lentisphaeraceae bacterium]|nr:hypothetical protein [Lentisphaeraceae bacterium]